MGEKAKRVKLDYDAICDELDIQGKSKTWLSAEIGRSRSYFSNLPGTRAGAIAPENMEALISRTLGYAPGTFVIQEEVNEAVEEDQVQVEFIETLYGNQKDSIFRMYYIDGVHPVKQMRVAEQMHMERSTISKKIDKYLQLSHNSHESHI